MCTRQVGPYNNPQETYNYYYLPFCQPAGKGEKPAHKWGGLGEVLQGNELIDSQLDLKFRSAPCFKLLGTACLLHGSDRGAWQFSRHVALHPEALHCLPAIALDDLLGPSKGQLRVALLACQSSASAT